MATNTKQSDAEKAAEAKTLMLLAELGGQKVQDDALVFQGTKFILPEQYQGRSIEEPVAFLYGWDKEQNNTFSITRQYEHHPYDVAYVFQTVLKEIFGTTGFGVTKMTMFGPEPPQFRTVNLGGGKTEQVPWGDFKVPILRATFSITATRDRNGQFVGYLGCEAPKKYRAQVDGVYKTVEERLKTVSLFRGRAMDANWLEPEFLDLEGVSEDKVAYSAETIRQLDANIWSVLEHTKAVQNAGMQLKRAVLLEGPYGTGKSLTGYLTAKKAVTNGWTFIYCRPGQELDQALHAARLLAPAVVFFEDLDVVAEPANVNESDRVSKLLDQFDGISNKTSPVMAVLTTNHVERLHKGMLRPGRLDAVIHIGELDPEGVRTLVESCLPEALRGDVNYEEVFVAMEGFLPAFIKEATQRAIRYSISRTKGKPTPVNTSDLVASARGLDRQLGLMTGANEKHEQPALEQALQQAVRQSVDGMKILDYDGDFDGKISAK